MVDSVVGIYGDKLSNTETSAQVYNFLLDRFKPLYQDQGISGDVVSAAMTQASTTAVDVDARIRAVNAFKALDSAADLVAANKRVGNILNKNNIDLQSLPNIDASLFSEEAEKELFVAIEAAEKTVNDLASQLQYTQILESLSVLKSPLNAFFEDVMIMADDQAVKANRVALVARARQLFLSVADVSLVTV
jgi:glycyl-tRNA synthetase beta chain